MPEGLARQPIEKEGSVGSMLFYPSNLRSGPSAAHGTESLQDPGLIVTTLLCERSR